MAISGLAATLALGTQPASATAWVVGVASGTSGEAQARGAPSTPSGVTSTCTSAVATTVRVSWNAATNATSYSVYSSTTSSSSGYSLYASGVSATSYTTGSLATGTYWFEVAAYTGTNWASSNSAATAARTIAVAVCT